MWMNSEKLIDLSGCQHFAQENFIPDFVWLHMQEFLQKGTKYISVLTTYEKW